MAAESNDIMVKMDVLDQKMESIIALILDIPAASRRYGLEKPSPFSMGSSEPANKPAIPNGPDDPPHVWESGIVKILALFDIPSVGLRWYADLGASVAEIRPFTEKQQNHFLDCGDDIPAGVYSYGTIRTPSPKWTLVKRVRNPQAPIPTGSRLAADGYSLEDDA